MNEGDIVVKIDFFTWETMPEKLKEIALKQGFLPPEEDEIIAVKTIMTKEEREAASKLESEKEELICECGHVIHEHHYDFKSIDSNVLFPCSKCDCTDFYVRSKKGGE
jgi:hypothetical protein